MNFRGPVNRLVFAPPSISSYDGSTVFQEHDASLFYAGQVPCIVFPYAGSKKVILMAHANAEDMWCSHADYDMMRLELKVHVIVFEYPGYGMWRGVVPSEAAVHRAADQVFDMVHEGFGIPASDIVLFGRSLGAAVACALASRRCVGGLVMLSPFSSIRDMAKQALSVATLGVGGFLGTLVADMFISKEAIRLVSCPTLLLHGAVDLAIPSRHSQVLFKACGSTHKVLHILEGMHHDNCFEEPHFYEILLNLQTLLDKPARGGAQELQIPSGARYEQGRRYPAGRCEPGVRYSALLRAMAVEICSRSPSSSAATTDVSSSPSRAWGSREIPKCVGVLPMCSRGWGQPIPRVVKSNPRHPMASTWRSSSPSTLSLSDRIASPEGTRSELHQLGPSHERVISTHIRASCSSETPLPSCGASLSPGGCKLSPAQRIKAHRDENSLHARCIQPMAEPMKIDQNLMTQSPHLHVSSA